MGYYGAERTIGGIARHYYWMGLSHRIINHMKNCTEFQRYKANNQNPAGLVQTPVMCQRFEIFSINLFGPLVPGPEGQRYILNIEEAASCWIELFALGSLSRDVRHQTDKGGAAALWRFSKSNKR